MKFALITLCGVLSLWAVGMLMLIGLCNPEVHPIPVLVMAGIGVVTTITLILVSLRK